MSGVTVKRDRKSLERFISELKSLQSKRVMVGWASGVMHPGNPGEQPVSMATVARVVNYGRPAGIGKNGKPYPAIPARPFMSLAFDRHLDGFRQMINRFYVQL